MIVVASRVAFCLTSSRVIKSFGAKPVRGGRPARDSIISIVVVERVGVFDHEVEICDIFVADTEIRDINIAAVIMRYNTKLKRESWGLNFKIIIIHPRWPIEEKAIIFRS